MGGWGWRVAERLALKKIGISDSMNNIADQTLVITGAGAGIGQALARGWVERGGHVVAVNRSAGGLEEAQRLCERATGTLECHVIDVNDARAMEALLADVVQRRGGVDVLVNGAAVYPRSTLSDTSPEAWAAGVCTNLNGVAYICRAAIRVLPANRAALILNVGSFAYLGPEPASTLYCATKSAVHAFTRALAVELSAAGSPIIVNEWVPGIYRTRMSGFTGEDPSVAVEHLLSVIALSGQGAGGRVFERGAEVKPPKGLRSRVKGWLTGHRG